MAWNPVKDAKKWFKKIENIGRDKVNWIEREARSKIREIGSEANKAVQKVEKAGHEIERTFEKRIPDLVTAEIPKALEKVVVDLLAEAGKPGLKTAAKLARQVHKALVKFRRKAPGPRQRSR